MEKIIVFTGAGFGNSLGLPTTYEFKSIIDENLSGPLSTALSSYLTQNYYDIEHLLSTLELFCKENNSLLKHILSKPPFERGTSQNTHLNIANDYISSLKNEANIFIRKLKASLFKILENYNKDLAKQLYSNLLLEIKTNYPRSAISFFSTNYDLTFEAVQEDLEELYETLSINQEINDGFITKKRSNVYNNKANKYQWDSNVIEYKKLHGSLDWTLTNRGIVKTNTVIEPSDLSNMLLIYPGFKGTPTEEPYKDLHDDLLQRLLSADSVHVIGFAFRDDFINNLFDTALKINNNLHVYCYNPSALDRLPRESKINSFLSTYPNKFTYYQKAIIANVQNPLELSTTP